LPITVCQADISLDRFWMRSFSGTIIMEWVNIRGQCDGAGQGQGSIMGAQ